MNRKKWIKGSLALSACLFLIWWVLGAGASLAWFSDADEVKNEFRFGVLDVDVQYKNRVSGGYKPLQGTTEAFLKDALYEPGYTQVVYLKIDNLGDADFQYKVAVTVEKVTTGRNQRGEEIYLPNYLCYGVVFSESQTQLEEMVADRLAARNHAPDTWGTLGTWSEMSPYIFEAGETAHYAALIVYMPEAVGNAANYRGVDAPAVELGITVFAQQVN